MNGCFPTEKEEMTVGINAVIYSFKTGDVAQLVENLLNIYKALGSIPSTT